MILSGSVCALIASPHILSVLSLACMNTCERKFFLIFNFSVYLMGFISIATGKVVHPAAAPAPAASPSHLPRCRLSPNSLQSSGAGPTHPLSGRPPHEGATRRGLRPPTSARSNNGCVQLGYVVLEDAAYNTSRNTCRPFKITCECSRVHTGTSPHAFLNSQRKWKSRGFESCKVSPGGAHFCDSLASLVDEPEAI